MKQILVTGSSVGLGFQLAKNLAEKGHRLILTGRSEEKLKKAINQLENVDKHIYFCGDLTDRLCLEDFFCNAECYQMLPDIILHNLGGKVLGDEHPLQVDILEKSMLLNLGVAVAINNYFLPKMVEKQSGRIVHISSDASLSGQSAPGYAAAKAAVNGYVKSAARYYAKYNVMICAVLPGIFEHEGSAWARKKISDFEYYRKKMELMPLGRFGSTKEIAYTVSDIACSDSMMCAGSLIELTAAY